MRCERARKLILEADPVDLRGGAAGDLTDHLTDCEACAELARSILDSEQALATAIDAMTPRTDVEQALARVPQRRSWRHRTRWKRAAWALPLAAAATAVLLLPTGPGDPGPSSAFDPEGPAMERRLTWDFGATVVRSASHENVVVLPTGNPDITVVWFTN